MRSEVLENSRADHQVVQLFRVPDQSLFTSLPNNVQAHHLVDFYRKGSPKGGLARIIARRLRRHASGARHRFVSPDGSFDLDLSYITPRLLGMGFPFQGVSSLFGNPSDELYRFFQERHAGHFRIFNLVHEQRYDLEMFHGTVALYPWEENTPPPLELLLPCCASMQSFYLADPGNVIAVHSRHGIGRVGVVIICYLIFSRLVLTVDAAHGWFTCMRTTAPVGVRSPAMLRYAHYFHEQLRRKAEGKACAVTETASRAVMIHAIMVEGVPKGRSKRGVGCQVRVEVGVRSENDARVHLLYSSDQQDTTVLSCFPKNVVQEASRLLRISMQLQ
jgi:protein-tyrosine phosphatase